MAPELVVYWYYRKVSQGQQARQPMKTVANFTHFLILNPDDYERGRMSLMERSHLAHYVWYIKPPGTLNGCLFCLLKTAHGEFG